MLLRGMSVGMVVCLLVGACGATKRNGENDTAQAGAGGGATGGTAAGGSAGTHFVPPEPEPACPGVKPSTGPCPVPGQVCRYFEKDCSGIGDAQWTVTCVDAAWTFSFLGSFDCGVPPEPCPTSLPEPGSSCNGTPLGIPQMCLYPAEGCDRVATCQLNAWEVSSCPALGEGGAGMGGEAGSPSANEAGQGGAR